MKKIVFAIPLLLVSSACTHKSTVKSEEMKDSVVTSMTVTRRPASGVKPASAVLKASAFRMSGDYSDNVAVGVGADGKLTYFPAPGDISENSAPVDLGNGWWLNRQGVGVGYRFTKYTFGEYSKLDQVPSAQELIDAVIPGAVVTEMRTFDIPASEAMSHIDELKTTVSNW